VEPTTDSDHYPEFDAPRPPLGTDPKHWNKAEARIYFDWTVEHVEPRSRGLLGWLGVEDRADHASVLREVGAAAVELLRSPRFSGPGEPTRVNLRGHEFDYDQGPVLSDEGEALAADLGLLVARYLLEDFETTVRFEIGGRPKSWIWHNLPILTGGGLNPFDPVGVSLANAFGVLRGERDETIWARIYEQAAALHSDGPRLPLRSPR
jgi:hypothetical protein